MPNTFGDAFTFGVAQERAEATRIQVVENRNEEMLVELKGVRKLFAHLPDAVEELQKHRRPIGVRVMVVAVTDALRTMKQLLIVWIINKQLDAYLLEFMSETEPLLFDEHLKSFHCAIVRIEQQHCQRRQLRRPIPSVRAMDHHGCAHVFNLCQQNKEITQHVYT